MYTTDDDLLKRFLTAHKTNDLAIMTSFLVHLERVVKTFLIKQDWSVSAIGSQNG